jgi:tetratricopeptide (TPR) repeat protein
MNAMENRIRLAIRLDTITIAITGIYLLLLPLLVSSISTDAYLIPKQIALVLVVLVGMVLFAVRGVITHNVRLRRTPFDLPIVLIIGAFLLSSIFAVNRFDSLITFVPFMLSALLFFVMTNTTKRKQDFNFLVSCLIIGGVLVSAVTLLSYLKIYPLPFAFAKAQTFTTFGALFDQLIYLVLVLSLGLYLSIPTLKSKLTQKDSFQIIFVTGSFLLILGSVITALAMFALQKPLILPLTTGFQTALASISQDTGRVVQGFLMGSGVGTYVNDFTRFKPAAFNTNAALWNLSFLRSSTYVLEILATTGLLGILSFLFLVYKILRTKPLFAPTILAVVFAFLIPFSFTTIMLFFILLAIYSIHQGFSEHGKASFFDVDLKLVALKRGVLALTDPSKTDADNSNILPWTIAILIAVFVFMVGMASIRFSISDYLFQQSLVAASKNDAQRTYQLQSSAIRMFPEREGYHRIFSQVNLSIANNLALSIPKGSKPTQDQQNTIYQLIQQAINSGRNATSISPQSSVDWQNLSSIYRALIGFGQNADQFSVLANQQSIVLDPNNPQEYIALGGIYYQLGQWDNAIRQFQIAASLKPDFPNAYYNLGHALEQKGDLQGALTQYQTVKSLVGNDKASADLISGDINTVQAKIAKGPASGSENSTTQNASQTPLGVNQPNAQLPSQQNPVKIPGPTTSVAPTKAPAR